MFLDVLCEVRSNYDVPPRGASLYTGPSLAIPLKKTVEELQGTGRSRSVGRARFPLLVPCFLRGPGAGRARVNTYALSGYGPFGAF